MFLLLLMHSQFNSNEWKTKRFEYYLWEAFRSKRWKAAFACAADPHVTRRILTWRSAGALRGEKQGTCDTKRSVSNSNGPFEYIHSLQNFACYRWTNIKEMKLLTLETGSLWKGVGGRRYCLQHQEIIYRRQMAGARLCTFMPPSAPIPTSQVIILCHGFAITTDKIFWVEEVVSRNRGRNNRKGRW